MRTTFWILVAALVLVFGVSSAQADTSTPTFTCTGQCSATPTAPAVSFPSPGIEESWDNTEANVFAIIDLAAGDNPNDMYTWENTISPDPIVPELADYTLDITDLRTGDDESASGMVGVSDILFETSITDTGTLTFATSGGGGGTTPAPEPSTVGLLLAGVAVLIAARKFWS